MRSNGTFGTSRETIKLAIIGGGINSAVGRAHISAINLVGHCKLIGGCFSTNPETNKASALEYGLDSGFLSDSLLNFSEKCKLTRPDLIVLLTPTNLHYQQLKFISQLQIPVLVEKALSTSVTEAIELSKLYTTQGIQNYVMFNYIGYPMVRELKSRVDKWPAGNVKAMKLQMPQESFIRVDASGSFLVPQQWRMSDYEIPTISLDLGVHLYSILQYVVGEKEDITSQYMRAKTLGRLSQVVDDVVICGSTSSGALVDFWFSKAALGYKNGLSIEIFGKEESLRWVQEYPDELTKVNSQGEKTILRRGDQTLIVANRDRYTRFKGGHPTGFVEAMANYYQDVFQDLMQTRLQDSQSSALPEDKIFNFDHATSGLAFLTP